MKNITNNLIENKVGQAIQRKGFIRKFIRLWGTTTVNGHEVLQAKKFFYPNSAVDSSYQKWAEHLGVWAETQDVNHNGMKSMWWYMNPAKDITNVISYEQMLANNINKAQWNSSLPTTAYTSMRFEVIIGPTFKRHTAPTLNTDISVLANQSAAIAEVVSRYEELWGTYKITCGNAKQLDPSNYYELGQTDKWANVFGRYLLRTGANVPYTIRSVSTDVLTIINKRISPRTEVPPPTVVKQLKVVIDVPYTELTATSDIIVMMKADMDSIPAGVYMGGKGSASNEALTKQLIEGLDNEPEFGDSRHDWIHPNYDDPLLQVTSPYWVQDPNDPAQWYLKTSTFTDTAISLEDRVTLLTTYLDTGYKQKTNFWQQLLTIGTIVASIIAAPFTGGSSLYLMAVAIAEFIVAVALITSIASAAYGAAGLTEASMSVGEFTKGIQPLVKIASILLILDAASNLTQELAKKGAAQMAAEGGIQTAEQILEESFSDAVMQGVVTSVEEIMAAPIADIATSNFTTIMNTAFGLYKKNQPDKMGELASLQKENEAYAKEMAQANDPTKSMMEAIYRPLQAVDSEYAELYDRPYEWWATAMHTGNMQAGSAKF